ncbi:hypothetical protein SVIOM342S_07164 [Streptomyces violaceorubidus]
MATSSDSAPSGTSIVEVAVSPCSIVGRDVSEEPSGPPTSLPSSGAYRLVTVQEASAGVPALASGTVTTSGSKDAPSTVTSSW